VRDGRPGVRAHGSEDVRVEQERKLGRLGVPGYAVRRGADLDEKMPAAVPSARSRRRYGVAVPPAPPVPREPALATPVRGEVEAATPHRAQDVERLGRDELVLVLVDGKDEREVPVARGAAGLEWGGVPGAAQGAVLAGRVGVDGGRGRRKHRRHERQCPVDDAPNLGQR